MLSSRAWAPAAFMPPATLAAGVCQIVLSSADTRSLPAQMWLALFVAALAPPFVLLSCARIRARFDGMLIGSGFMLTSVGMVCLFNLSMAPGPNQSFLS